MGNQVDEAMAAIAAVHSPARERLPFRRPSLGGTIEWAGRDWVCHVGFDPQGRAREIFLDCGKTGADVTVLMHDACVLASIALQGGWSAAELGRSLGRLSRPVLGSDRVTDEGPATPIGHALALAARLEAEHGKSMAQMQAALEAALP